MFGHVCAQQNPAPAGSGSRLPWQRRLHPHPQPATPGVLWIAGRGRMLPLGEDDGGAGAITANTPPVLIYTAAAAAGGEMPQFPSRRGLIPRVLSTSGEAGCGQGAAGGGPRGEQMETEATSALPGRGFAGVRDAVGRILPAPGYRFALPGWCITPSSCSSQWESPPTGIIPLP